MAQAAPRRGPGPLPPKLDRPEFPSELPIAVRIDEIVRLLRRNRVVIVAGETGSGKTTQLPKACLAAGLGRRGMIAHTQPRRLAARTVAARIAAELGVELGAEVGYAVRFSDRTGADTRIKVLTDGLLLNELQRDRRLRRYEAVIVDEAHERSLNIDFILGCLKRLLAARRDFKVVVTSATIDVAAFAAFFGGAPIVEVSGRGYPVDIRYQVPESGDAEPEDSLVEALRSIARDSPAGRRDVLVFQSGEREIFDSAQLLKRQFAERFDILPLYARLPAAEQQRVFQPGDRQRVVLATNVAETSITVPNIGYVVDPGRARISRYSVRSKLQRLPVERISQASAAQRAGRCGRIAPGVCYRLYSEADFAARPAYTDPELKRSNLAAVVLAMRAFRLGDIERFPFIDPPEGRAVRDALRLLRELGALAGDELTDTGRAMARLPVDPRLARMLIEAGRTGALAEALIVVSALAAQDPRLRPLDRREAADALHAEFEHRKAGQPGSDFLAFVNLWQWLEEARQEHTRSGLRRMLEKRFLSPPRVREWRALHRQLLLACRDLGLRLNREPADYATLHRALLTGSLGFIGNRRDAQDSGAHAPESRRRFPEYDGARGVRFRLFPGSGLRRSAPRWVVAAEISDSAASGAGGTFARGVAAVEPEWIETAAAHLAKSTFSEPLWDAGRGEAVVSERITVYGLTVVAARRRRAAEVDAAAARALFVREALVGRRRQPSRMRLRADVLDRNEQLARRIEERQAKHRRGDLLVGEKVRAAFYEARLPAEVCSAGTWERFVRRAGPAGMARLAMTEADLLTGTEHSVAAEDFPSRLVLGDLTIALVYKFAPGEPDDGVTSRVDPATLSRLDADALEWLVPGFFEAKCEALVRSLPKALRRQLAPVPDRLRAILPLLQAPSAYRRGSLGRALSAAIRRTVGVAIPEAEWRPERLPRHLRMNIEVRGARRRVVDRDRDLAALKQRLLTKVEQAIAGDGRADFEQRGIAAFPQGGVPSSLTVPSSAGPALAYPVLVDRGSSVDLLLHATPRRRRALNRGGYTRLALLAEAKLARQLRREVETMPKLGLHYAPLGTLASLADALVEASAWFAFFDGRELPATASAFEQRLASGRGDWRTAFREVLGHAERALAKRTEVARRIDALRSPAFAAAKADLAAQLDALVGAKFPLATPRDRLPDLVRYLDAMLVRMGQLQGRVARDQAGMASVAVWQERLAALVETAAEGPDVAALRFAIEEFRIATFSQRVGTRGKVSAKRLASQFEAVEGAAGGN